jgi:hypothetical protein
MTAKEYEKMSDSEKKKEDWMNSKWRPMMGWTYMLTCIFDFVMAPILWSLLQALSKGQVNVQWQPLTLQGAGLFHIAMGAVLGIAAYGRTQEKMNGANNGGINLPANVGTTYTPPSATPAATTPATFGTPTSTTVTQSWGQPAASGFATSQPGFGAVPPVSAFSAPPTVETRPAQPTGRVSPKTGREMILAPHEDEFGSDGEPMFKGDPEEKA